MMNNKSQNKLVEEDDSDGVAKLNQGGFEILLCS